MYVYPDFLQWSDLEVFNIVDKALLTAISLLRSEDLLPHLVASEVPLLSQCLWKKIGLGENKVNTSNLAMQKYKHGYAGNLFNRIVDKWISRNVHN